MTTLEQIQAWKVSVLDACDQLDYLRNALATQREAMNNNTDYSDEDRAQVDQEITEVNNRINEL